MHASSIVSANDIVAIPNLVLGLASSDPQTRAHCRAALVKNHSPAAREALVGELSDPRDHVRWEAAKALSAIHDPVTAPAFLEALDDENGDVRWVAAEGLAALGKVGLLAALHGLTKHSRSMAFCRSAHHALHLLSDGGYAQTVAPVLAALEQTEPAVATPPVAFRVLSQFKIGRDE